ncbi:hypothetical protein M5689_006052 [Euphorbia peplus]|nr:hypothetical protein M5689_006052 [Euphorbia peplus]
MARYGWNLNNVSRRTYGGQPQIACRICNNVFMSTQALIDHIETHMSIDHDPRISSFSGPRRPQPPLSLNNVSNGTLSLLTGQRINTNTNNFNFPIPSPNMPMNMPYNPSVYSSLASYNQDRNFMFNPNPPQIIPPQPAPNMYSPYMAMRNNYAFGSQFFPNFPFQAPRKFNTENMNRDATKPFLQQLEKPITPNSNFQLNAHKRKRSEFEMLDLNLKL